MGSTRYYGHALPGVKVTVDMDGQAMPIAEGDLPAAKRSLLIANATGRNIIQLNMSFGDEIDATYVADCDVFDLTGGQGAVRHILLPTAASVMCLLRDFGPCGTTFSSEAPTGQVATPLLVMSNNGFSDAAAWMIAQHLSPVTMDLRGNCFLQGAVDQLMQFASAFSVAAIDISGSYPAVDGVASAVPTQDIVVTADAEDTDGINGTYAKTAANTWTRTTEPAATITYEAVGSKWVITVGAVHYSFSVEDETWPPVSTPAGYIKDGGEATATTAGSETSQYFWMLALTGCVITTN